MNITVIGPSAFGYIDYLVAALRKKEGVAVNYINFSDMKYRYTSIPDKVWNGFKKIVFNYNIKDEYRSEQIIKLLQADDKQDFIVVIRPDKLEKKLLVALKSFTVHLYAFYFDAIAKFPTKKELIPYFDKVFSYEKKDTEQYNLDFITNYIYDRNLENKTTFTYKVFNISSYDERFNDVEKVASYLKGKNVNYRIIVRKERVFSSDLVEIVPNYISLREVKECIASAEILLDIQKKNQYGLSFRVFEALGYEKKLITTNTDIVHYDFYNPNNILVIHPDAPHIPDEFLSTPYERVPESILHTYSIEYWIDRIFTLA